MKKKIKNMLTRAHCLFYDKTKVILIGLGLMAYPFMSDSLWADHGPSTTGAGFMRPDAEILPAKHVQISLGWQNLTYNQPSENDMRLQLIRMGNVGDHYDALGSGQLMSFSVTASISNWWDVTFFGGWYNGHDIRIGLIDGKKNYKLVNAGGISGFTDPGAVGKVQVVSISWLTLTGIAGFNAPLGRSTKESDYRNLDEMPILTSIRPPMQNSQGVSPHLVPGTELAAGGGSFVLEPAMMPGQKTWSIKGGIAAKFETTKDRFISLSFMAYHWIPIDKVTPTQRFELGLGLPALKYQNTFFAMDLLYRYRMKSASKDYVYPNSGGQEIYLSAAFNYLWPLDIRLSIGFAIPVWQMHNRPQQSLGMVFFGNTGIRLHFE